MANEVQTTPEPSVTALVTGILNDAQRLFQQQLALIRSEIRQDFRKTQEASVLLGVGVGVCGLAAVMLSMTLALLLWWLTLPVSQQTDPARIPLWGCFAIVGVILAAVGGILAYAGVKKFQSFNPLPDQSVAALQENLQWTTHPTTTPR
jgi:Putative Actinobacterial Holin-X, holin superfamily III